MNKEYMLAQEEIKALKMFLGLFYGIFFLFYILCYFILPMMNLTTNLLGIPKEGLGIWFYILVIALILPCLYLIKTDRPYSVKYVIFIGYNLIDFINKMLTYYETNNLSVTTNLIELFLIIFAPLFVNRRYFWWVNVGIIIKYTIIGFVLKTPAFIVQLAMVAIIVLLCWMMLVRVNSYINTVEKFHIKVKQSEKLAVIGEMATVIGHEIRNPLTALKGFTKLQAERHPEDCTYYDIMNQEIERMNEIISELMLFGKPKLKEYKLYSVEEIILYVVQVVKQLASKHGVTIKTEFEKGIPKIYCDEKQMKQVFLNLFKNAIEAMTSGGNITVIVATNKDEINIFVIDTGYGIVEDEIPKLGEAFYTTKESGTGLGLMVTYKIIEEHEGTMQFLSNVGEGTTVKLTFPVA